MRGSEKIPAFQIGNQQFPSGVSGWKLLKRRTLVKVAFTTSGKTLDAPMDTRFGRAMGFILYDTDSETFEAVDNQQSVNTAQGAGIQATEAIVRHGANCLVTGHCGPNAFRALSAASITIYTTEAATVAEALQALRAGTLATIKSADVEGHWS
jgi:predicted Fe-Mo cluster-binding NifX family protein